MKDQLSAVVSVESGNVIAIFSNVDDAIELAVNYETRSGDKFEIQDISKYGAKDMVDREWVKQTGEVVGMWLSGTSSS